LLHSRRQNIRFILIICVALKRADFAVQQLEMTSHLSTESVQSSALAFQSVDDIHGCDSLALGVLGVGDCVTDHVLKEDLQNTTGLLVDQTRDTLDTTSTCKTTDSWLRDTLDVITKYFSVTLGASFSKSFTSFAASRHVASSKMKQVMTSKRPKRLYIRYRPSNSTDSADKPISAARRNVARTHVSCQLACARARARTHLQYISL